MIKARLFFAFLLLAPALFMTQGLFAQDAGDRYDAALERQKNAREEFYERRKAYRDSQILERESYREELEDRDFENERLDDFWDKRPTIRERVRERRDSALERIERRVDEARERTRRSPYNE